MSENTSGFEAYESYEAMVESITQDQWRRAMEKTAVGVAFPTWPWRDDDVVDVDVDAGSKAYHYSEYTFDSGSPGHISVDVRRSDHEDCHYKACTNGDVHRYRKYEEGAMEGFWVSLMTGGAR